MTRRSRTRRTIASATPLPVSADLENGYGDHPDDVAETVRMARAAGLAGCSIEDFTGDEAAPIYDLDLAAERVVAAARAARSGGERVVLTARAENHLHGRDDLADTIARLRVYAQAGADVVYAPGLHRIEDIRAVVDAVAVPVNALARPGVPPVAELSAAGVARVSVLRILGAGDGRRRRLPLRLRAVGAPTAAGPSRRAVHRSVTLARIRSAPTSSTTKEGDP